MRLFLDLDGVLADFDAYARELLHTDNTYKFEYVYGKGAFWRGLNQDPHFFYNLDPTPDAADLWLAVRHLDPMILTALPKKDAQDVADQKSDWVAEFVQSFGEIDDDDLPRVITCLTEEKPDYCLPGDILIDDRAFNKVAWEEAGGRFILHTDALSSIRQLQLHGII